MDGRWAVDGWTDGWVRMLLLCAQQASNSCGPRGKRTACVRWVADVCLFGRHLKILHAVFHQHQQQQPSPAISPSTAGLGRIAIDAVHWVTLHVLCPAGKKNDLSPSPRNHHGWRLLLVWMTTHPPYPPLDEPPTLLHSPLPFHVCLCVPRANCAAEDVWVWETPGGRTMMTVMIPNQTPPKKEKEKKRVALICRSNRIVSSIAMISRPYQFPLP